MHLPQTCINSSKESPQPIISPIQLNPFDNAQAEQSPSHIENKNPQSTCWKKTQITTESHHRPLFEQSSLRSWPERMQRRPAAAVAKPVPRMNQHVQSPSWLRQQNLELFLVPLRPPFLVQVLDLPIVAGCVSLCRQVLMWPLDEWLQKRERETSSRKIWKNLTFVNVHSQHGLDRKPQRCFHQKDMEVRNEGTEVYNNLEHTEVNCDISFVTSNVQTVFSFKPFSLKMNQSRIFSQRWSNLKSKREEKVQNLIKIQ